MADEQRGLEADRELLDDPARPELALLEAIARIAGPVAERGSQPLADAVEVRVEPGIAAVPSSHSARNDGRPSGSLTTARSTSSAATLPEPSQIDSSGASRYSSGMPESSTNPLPPRHSSASAACAAARLQTQYFITAVANRRNAASEGSS